MLCPWRREAECSNFDDAELLDQTQRNRGCGFGFFCASSSSGWELASAVCCLDTLDGVLPRCSTIASGLCALGSTVDVVGSVAQLWTRYERSGQLFTSKEDVKKFWGWNVSGVGWAVIALRRAHPAATLLCYFLQKGAVRTPEVTGSCLRGDVMERQGCRTLTTSGKRSVLGLQCRRCD